jgi:hypothetical protein
MKLNRMLVAGIVVGCVLLPGGQIKAGESAGKRPVIEVEKFGDSVIDNALSRLSETMEIAVVQVDQLKELASRAPRKGRDAQTKELQFAAREQSVCDISALLYSDQVPVFQDAYESQLDATDGALRKMARARMQTILGRIEIEPAERKDITVALVNYYRQIQPAEAALEAACKDRLADPKVAGEYRDKQEAFLKPVRLKTLEIANRFLKEDKQREVSAEWKRRQDRRISLTLKDLKHEFAPGTTEVQTKRREAAIAAFREAAKDLDLDSSNYEILHAKLREEMGVVVTGE